MPIINQVVKGSGGSAPAHYVEKTVDANGKLVNRSTTVIDFTGVTDIGDYVLQNAYLSGTFPQNTVLNCGSLSSISGIYAMQNAFKDSTGLKEFNMGVLTYIGGNAALSNVCNGSTTLTSFDLHSLERISGNTGLDGAFQGCTGLTGVIDLHSLYTIGNYGLRDVLNGCTGITGINLESLVFCSATSGMSGMIRGCNRITSLSLPSLCLIKSGSTCNNMCRDCTQLTSIYFPALTSTSFGSYTNQFDNMLYGVTGCTVHFPSNLQSIIGSWASVTSGFGGTNTTVLYDLPATVILTGANTVAYQRNPKYDTGTALAWRVQDVGSSITWTPYYTSGTTDPVVNDTIYSDAACTTAVTTIDTIA